MLRNTKGQFAKGNKGFWLGKKRENMMGEKNYKWKGSFIKNCIQCKKEFSVLFYRKDKAKFCSHSCRARFAFTGNRNPLWKGGISEWKDTVKSKLEYKNWRMEVYRRDHFTCRVCGFRSKGSRRVDIHAHHIIPMRDDESKWFDVSNGITLCVNHHRETYGKEEKFVKVFKEILNDYTPNNPKG